MSDTRYGHSGTGGGRQDQGERKDEGWESRQGGRQSHPRGTKGEPQPANPDNDDRRSQPPPGTNTQGNLAGIGDASDRVATEHEQDGWPDADTNAGGRSRDMRARGTDQPPRMGGPLGPDPQHPHLPEGAQDSDDRGTGAGGFDVGVDAKNVGTVHQGARPEQP